MLKLLISLIIIVLFIQSVMPAKKSTNENCPIYSYKPFNDRSNILSSISNNTIISELSLIGTHESMSYITSDLKIRTQDISVTQQLMYGVRFLDLSVRYSKSKILEIYSRSVDLNFTLNNVLQTAAVFLQNNQQEFVIINLKYDGNVYSDDVYDEIFNNYLGDNDAESCQSFKNLNSCVIKNWKLQSTVESVRGKILLSTTDSLFSRCMFYINNECLLSNHVSPNFFGDGFDYYPIVNYKWMKYVVISTKDDYNNYECYVYDLSIYDNYSLFSQGFAKNGGYYSYSGQCIEPINYRLYNRYSNHRNASLTVILVDYVIPEIIDKVDNFNKNKLT
ncbi:hypothetical protein KQX54_001331 [Cotesia glomerata]|uniref:Phosphatidylinositol-specific phospholipase C X domain-containing protein n=1 Tax=Cotesia glomerata TaxID=32391 RepID=A0AAV7I8K9_COTGL|nr:hypothetical protein KQX54_001331 [Cotesia glomerata]